MSRSAVRRDVIAYLSVLMAAAVGVAVILPHSSAAPVILGFVPATVVALFALIHGRSALTGLGLGRPGFAYWPIAIALPVMLGAICYAFAFGFGAARGPGDLRLSPASLLISALITTVAIMGEEIGWRGYLLPRLQELTTRPKGALLTGLAQATFHLPLVLFTTTYNSEGSRWIVAPLMMVTITAGGICYGWLRDASRSLWPVALAHACTNTIGMAIASTALPTATASLAQIAGEGGVVTAVAVTATAVVVYLVARRGVWRPEVTQPAQEMIEVR